MFGNLFKSVLLVNAALYSLSRGEITWIIREKGKENENKKENKKEKEKEKKKKIKKKEYYTHFLFHIE